VKIAYVLNTYPEGSHSFIRREIAALQRRGFEVARIAMRRPARAPTDPQDIAETAQTHYVLEQGGRALVLDLAKRLFKPKALAVLQLALKVGRKSESGRLKHMIYLAEACAVARQCKAKGVDHIHAHFGTNAATVAMLASELSGIPYSFTVHGPEEFDQPISLSLGEKITRSKFTVGISQFGRSQLCRWVDPAHWGKIKVVHCGIDPAKFPDGALHPMPDGALRLVNIGRFAEQKGQMLLLEAMAEVIKTAPDTHLTLVGDGDLRGDIEASIKRLGLDANVTLAGWLNEDQVSAALGQAHALVLPSFAEGLPMVVMEAMASARPVITTYIAGIPELMQNGETGWLVPAGDVQACADAILELQVTSNAKRMNMGQAGRARVLERHDINALAAQLDSYFNEA